MDKKRPTGSTVQSASNFSASMYMASDADGEVAIDDDDDEEITSDVVKSLTMLAVDPCHPCRQKGNKPNEAKWRCADCRKDMCDNCSTMHDLFTQGHNVSRLTLQPCAPCKKKNTRMMEGKWYCSDCKQQMCDDCKEFHEMFTTGHTITSGKRHPVEPSDGGKVAKSGSSKQTKPAGRPEDQGRFPSTKSPKEPVTIPKQQFKDSGDKSKVESSGATKVKRERSFHFMSEIDTRSPNDEKQPYIRGVSFLPDGRLLMVDSNNKKLMLFCSDFKLQNEKQITKIGLCVAVYDNKEVAVGSIERIIRLSVEGDIKDLIAIHLKFSPLAIAYVSKTTFAVTTANNLRVINIDGTEMQNITTDPAGNFLFKDAWFIAVDRRLFRAYISDSLTERITAVDLSSGTVLFSYSVGRTAGLCVDKNGDIFCIGIEQHHQISSDGEQICQFSTPEVKGAFIAIAIHPDNRTAIVAGGNKSAVYKLV